MLSDFESGKVPLLEFIRSVNRLQQDGGPIVHDPSLGKAVVTCFGRHTEGRDLMAGLLTMHGFSTVSADRDASLDEIVGLCRDPEVTVLCMSVQTTYDCPEVLGISNLLEEAGIRQKVVLNIGGAAISARIAEKAGCDVYSDSASESAKRIKDEVRRRTSRRRLADYAVI